MGFKIPGLGDIEDALKKGTEEFNKHRGQNEEKPEDAPDQTSIQNAAPAQKANTPSTDVDPSLVQKVRTDLNKFHSMLESQGPAMQEQMGFDVAGAKADGDYTLGDTAVLIGQFAGQVNISERAKSRVDMDAYQGALEAVLGDEKDVLKSLSKTELESTFTLLSMPQRQLDRTMQKAMQDPKMKALREFPKQDKISQVFYVPASGDEPEMVIDMNKNNSHLEGTTAYVEVQAEVPHVNAPDLDNG